MCWKRFGLAAHEECLQRLFANLPGAMPVKFRIKHLTRRKDIGTEENRPGSESP